MQLVLVLPHSTHNASAHVLRLLLLKLCDDQEVFDWKEPEDKYQLALCNGLLSDSFHSNQHNFGIQLMHHQEPKTCKLMNITAN